MSPLGRDEEKIEHIRKYLQSVGMFRDFSNSSQDPDFTQVDFPSSFRFLLFFRAFVTKDLCTI